VALCLARRRLLSELARQAEEGEFFSLNDYAVLSRKWGLS